MNKTRVQLAEERGQLLATRAALLELLEGRFGPLPSDLAGRVNTTDQLTTLKSWHRTAVTICDLDAFRATIAS